MLCLFQFLGKAHDCLHPLRLRSRVIPLFGKEGQGRFWKELSSHLRSDSQEVKIMESTPFSEFDLSGKVALVTGAARGMGREFALALAKYGADLVVCDILPDLQEIKPEIERLGRRVLIRQAV